MNTIIIASKHVETESFARIPNIHKTINQEKGKSQARKSPLGQKNQSDNRREEE